MSNERISLIAHEMRVDREETVVGLSSEIVIPQYVDQIIEMFRGWGASRIVVDKVLPTSDEKNSGDSEGYLLWKATWVHGEGESMPRFAPMGNN